MIVITSVLSLFCSSKFPHPDRTRVRKHPAVRQRIGNASNWYGIVGMGCQRRVRLGVVSNSRTILVRTRV